MLLFLEGLSLSEVLVIILVIVLLFGPKKIPEIARGLAKGMRTMKEATEDIKKEILKEPDDINPIKNIQEEIQSAKSIVEKTSQELDTSIKKIDENLGSVKR